MNYIWLGIAIFIGWMIGKYILDIPTFLKNLREALRHHKFLKAVKIAFIQGKS